jgi:hypothetical protein
MNNGFFARSFGTAVKLGLAGLVAAAWGLFGAAPALASAPVACSQPALSQPFAPLGDSKYYTLVSGQDQNQFLGTGWTLSGGASLVNTQLPNGTTTSVLNLPSGSRAISPVVCVNSSFPTMRTMVRDVVGSEGVFFYVSYPNQPGWKNTGQVHGQNTSWTLSDPVNIQTDSFTGWVQGQFEFVAGGQSSDFQLYNFYIDPYSK